MTSKPKQKAKPITDGVERRQSRTPVGDFSEKIHTKGAVRFTETVFEAMRPSEPPTFYTVREPWESFDELSLAHAQPVFHIAVLDYAPPDFAAKGRLALVADIKARVPDIYWARFEERLVALDARGNEHGHGDVYVTAVWAALFAEQFEAFWLSAIAQHAYYVEEDDYKVGYLTALLDQKTQNEGDLRRGRTTRSSASKGGETNAAKRKPQSLKVLNSMVELVDKGLSRARAAQLVYDRGIGTSVEANKALWKRHYSRHTGQ